MIQDHSKEPGAGFRAAKHPNSRLAGYVCGARGQAVALGAGVLCGL